MAIQPDPMLVVEVGYRTKATVVVAQLAAVQDSDPGRGQFTKITLASGEKFEVDEGYASVMRKLREAGRRG